MFDWTRLEQPVRVKVELDKPLMERRERGKLVQGDENANAIVAEVYQTDGVPYDLTGSTVTLTFVRPDNLAAPPITAEIVGDANNIAVATLTDTCYRYSGMYAASLKIAKGVVERTIVRIIGDVVSTENSGVVDDEVLFPSPEELLETLAQVETARQNAETAAARANTAAARAEQLQIDASGLAGDSNKLGGKAPEYYLSPRNLLDDSDFAIAQAGRPVWDAEAEKWTSGAHGSTPYAADRWRGIDYRATYSFGEKGLTHASPNGVGTYLAQRLENPKKYAGKQLTFAVNIVANSAQNLAIRFRVDGTIIGIQKPTGTGVFTTTITIPTTASETLIVEIGMDGGNYTVQWAALYEGTYTADTLPPFVPRPYAVELAECELYFQRYTGKYGFAGFVNGAGNTIFFSIPLRHKLRTSDISFDIKGLLYGKGVGGGGGITNPVFTYASQGSTDVLTVSIPNPNTTYYPAGTAVVINIDDADISIGADL